MAKLSSSGPPKDSKAESTITISESTISLPAHRGKCLLVVAVPTSISPQDFIFFFKDDVTYATDILFIMDDKLPDRYSVFLQFQFDFAADEFYKNMNRYKFSSGEAVLVLFVAAMDFQVTSAATHAPNDSVELPTCPLCLDRLRQQISGPPAACDHYQACRCVWQNSSCPVCKFCRTPVKSSVCSICKTTENICICMVCGVASCGRYFQNHSKEHGKSSFHGYSLDLESQSVVDSMDGTVDCLYQSEFSNKYEKAISMQNREFFMKLQSENKMSATSLEAAAKETKHCIDNAASNKRQQLHNMYQELEGQKRNAVRTNDKLSKERSSLDEQLEYIKGSLELKDEEIKTLKHDLAWVAMDYLFD